MKKKELENKEIKENVNLKNYKSTLKIVMAICVVLVIVIICLVIYMNKENTNNNINNNANPQTNNNSNNTNNNNAIQVKTIEELKTNSKSDIEKLTIELENEWKTLSEDIATFNGYKNNKEKISNFYDKIVKNSEDFSIRIREYALKYAEMIINSDKSFNDKYDELGDIYYDIYEDVSEDLYDDIYDGLLVDMYDYYYDGILEDAYDNVPYSDYSDMRSAEYKNYSNARSDVYKAYSKARSDVYQFYSKLRSKIYSKDLDRTKETIQDFSKDIDKLKNK